jgi:hypothetical protein
MHKAISQLVLDSSCSLPKITERKGFIIVAWTSKYVSEGEHKGCTDLDTKPTDPGL